MRVTEIKVYFTEGEFNEEMPRAGLLINDGELILVEEDDGSVSVRTKVYEYTKVSETREILVPEET